MKAAIHQLNYFPWMGYFNKMASCDTFVLLDEVQLTDSSTMQRNRILNKNGDPSWLTVAFEKKDYLKKPFDEILLNPSVDWQLRQKNLIVDTYKKLPFFNEVWNRISPVFEQNFEKLIDVNKTALNILVDLLEIETEIVYQSSLEYDRSCQKNDLLIEILKCVNADTYLSGIGAKKYMDPAEYKEVGISVEYQDFQHPEYKQFYSQEFVPGLSILDVLFNCGIEKTKLLFNSTLRR